MALLVHDELVHETHSRVEQIAESARGHARCETQAAAASPERALQRSHTQRCGREDEYEQQHWLHEVEQWQREARRDRIRQNLHRGEVTVAFAYVSVHVRRQGPSLNLSAGPSPLPLAWIQPSAVGRNMLSALLFQLKDLGHVDVTCVPGLAVV